MPEYVIRRPEQGNPESPEALFRELRPRDPNIRDLYLRQGELLRKYSEVADRFQDVALELQTGAGKTLVGFLIAEFRRRKFGHRVAYLCPNIQLARQAASKAYSYGLDVVTLVRAQKDWDPGEFLRFNRGEAVAVATYHQVFNTHPRMDSAQTIILDDAHSGEDPVASMWSLVLGRSAPAYKALLAIFADSLPEPFLERLRDDSADPRQRWDVELISPSILRERATSIIEALNACIRDDRDPAYYRYVAIGDRVGRCLALVSWNEILLRPLIPPTLLWPAFAAATQRVYMSATVGQEGELERAFGVPAIEHLSVSTPAEDLRFGRRFFLFPDAAFEKQEADHFTAASIRIARRALVLTPSHAEAERAINEVLPPDYPVLRAGEVENDFTAFTSREDAAVVLANRYDGMDLPDDACRLIVLTGIPAQTHLLERFFLERLAARRLLSERIRTRFVQGAGRCTRNSRDFAAVIVRGWGLTHFWEKSEEVKACRPDLQAEIEFGFDNANQTSGDLLELLNTFLTQGESWRGADDAIRSMAADAKVVAPPDGDALCRAAQFEVEAWSAIWRHDVLAAVTAAEGVLDALEGGQELRPYRALWLYIAASWADEVAATSGTKADRQRADSFKSSARQCAGPLPWTPSFGDAKAPTVGAEYDEGTDRALKQMKQLGLRGMGFERRLDATKADLESLEAERYHRALVITGELLGFEATLADGAGAPDVAWRYGDWLTVVFEAKTEEAPDKALSLDAVRQAGTHLAWVHDNLKWPISKRGVAVIVGKHTRMGDGVSRTVAADVALVSPDEVLALFLTAVEVHREIRARSRGLSDEQLQALLRQELDKRALTATQVADRLVRRLIADL
jgi:hypothetical protein